MQIKLLTSPSRHPRVASTGSVRCTADNGTDGSAGETVPSLETRLA